MQNKYLEGVRESMESVSAKIDSEFKQLTEKQLNWKPTPDAWSVAQCIDHIITINKLYIPQLQDIADETHVPGFWQKCSLFHGFFANSLRKKADPNNSKKSKTAAVFNPAISDARPILFKDFENNQRNLFRLMDQTDHLDHNKIKVSSPAARYVAFSLKNCWIIIALHQERHYIQAKKLTKRSTFPKRLGERNVFH